MFTVDVKQQYNNNNNELNSVELSTPLSDDSLFVSTIELKKMKTLTIQTLLNFQIKLIISILVVIRPVPVHLRAAILHTMVER